MSSNRILSFSDFIREDKATNEGFLFGKPKEKPLDMDKVREHWEKAWKLITSTIKSDDEDLDKAAKDLDGQKAGDSELKTKYFPEGSSAREMHDFRLPYCIAILKEPKTDKFDSVAFSPGNTDRWYHFNTETQDIDMGQESNDTDMIKKFMDYDVLIIRWL